MSLGRLTPPSRVVGFESGAEVGTARLSWQILRIGLVLAPLILVAVIVGLEPLFLADPLGRLALILGVVVFGLLLVRYPEVFFGLWVAGVVPIFLSYYPSTRDFHGWGLLPLAGILLYVVRRKEVLLPLSTLVLSQVAFLAMLCASIAYTSDAEYGVTKAWDFLYFNLVALVGPMFLVNDFRRVKNILVSFAVGAVLFALSGLYFFYEGSMEEMNRLTAFTSHPIGFGQVCGISAAILLCLVFTSRMKMRWLLSPVLVLVVYLTVLTGTRGALVALILAATVLAVVGFRRHPTSAVLAACAAAVAIFLAFQYAPIGYTERFYATRETLLQEERLSLWNSGYHMFMNSPFIGGGAGAFHEYVGGMHYYPHNIFVEIGAELGLLGLAVFLAFLVLTLKSALSVVLSAGPDEEVRQVMLVLLVCFVFSLVAAQFSLDINGNSKLWLFSGLIWCASMAAKARKQMPPTCAVQERRLARGVWQL